MQHRQDMLDTIFYWIAGMGNTDPRHMIDPDAVFHDDKIQDHSEGKSYLIDLADFSQPAIPLQQLIVTNLPDQHDDRLNTSEAFLKIMSMPSLRDIRLHVEPRINILHPVASSPFSPGKYKFFNNLHVSWLAPDIAGNLQILTLNYKEFWGWCPKMDFRRFELPQLKALSLGRYVFSHQWQIDWFASIGNGNGSGGLEELYLHDCPILYEATHIGPFDTSDPGYPLQESVLGMTGDCETHNYPIRWHDVFSQWAGSLNNLKVFHMGKSTYQNSRNKTFRRKLNVQNESQRHQIWYDLQEELASPCPSGPPTYSRLKQASSLKGQLTSIEFNQNRRFQMKYIEFDIGRMCHNPHWPWVRRGNSNECWAPEEGTVVRDAAAYEVFMDAVHSRVVV
ncbi:hypothetical protein NXS19_010663 [Fusarium pseudograminearum]|nr:hypothetical protein NXS19_010663 [Fusarium pseudograminearum]